MKILSLKLKSLKDLKFKVNMKILDESSEQKIFIVSKMYWSVIQNETEKIKCKIRK